MYWVKKVSWIDINTNKWLDGDIIDSRKSGGFSFLYGTDSISGIIRLWVLSRTVYHRYYSYTTCLLNRLCSVRGMSYDRTKWHIQVRIFSIRKSNRNRVLYTSFNFCGSMSNVSFMVEFSLFVFQCFMTCIWPVRLFFVL